MNYRSRQYSFYTASLILHTGLVAFSSYLAVLITEKKHQAVNYRESFLSWSALIALVWTSPLRNGLRSLAEARQAHQVQRSTLTAISTLYIAFSLGLELMFMNTNCRIHCNTKLNPKCQPLSPLLVAGATLIAQSITALILWPLAKWSAPTAEEAAVVVPAAVAVARNVHAARGRPEAELILISTLPNSDVLENCPITGEPPESPVRFACPNGNFRDSAGNRVSTAMAFEQYAAIRAFNLSPQCPITRQPITGLVPAPDVVNRQEPIAADSPPNQPLLPNDTGLQAFRR